MRIIISGYYGFGNIGDEAILASIVQGLSHPGRELVVLSNSPERTRREYGVRAIGRYDLARFAAEARGASLFVSGGGGLLQDVTGPASVPYYLGLMRIAQWLGTPTMIMAQGIGPVRKKLNHRLISHVVKRASLVTVRDPDSASFLSDLGVSGEKLHLTADPVLALEPAPPARVLEIMGRLGLDSHRPTIAVAIRPWYTWYERQFKAFTAVLGQLATRLDVQLLLLPFQYPGDLRITQEMEDCLSLRPPGHAPKIAMLDFPLTPREMAGVIGAVDFVVGMRLHSLIMAAAQAIPALGISYDPKVRGFAQQLDLPVIESVSGLAEADRTARAIEEAWHRRGELHRLLAASMPQWRQQARLNYSLALRLCGVDMEAQGV